MRKGSVVLVALLLVLPAGEAQAAGHPGHGPGEVVIADNAFTPRTITVATGDTVI